MELQRSIVVVLESQRTNIRRQIEQLKKEQVPALQVKASGTGG